MALQVSKKTAKRFPGVDLTCSSDSRRQSRLELAKRIQSNASSIMYATLHSMYYCAS